MAGLRSIRTITSNFARTDGIVRRIAYDVGATVNAHKTLAVIECAPKWAT